MAKSVRIVYELADGSTSTQTFAVLDEATQEDLEAVVNKIKTITTRTVLEAYLIVTTPMNV